MTELPDSVLDHVLAIQLTVAWAGEGMCEPPRLGWWKTDLVDAGGGGDFFQRLAPRTHRWASLIAVREAARRVEDKARRGSARADRVRSLFHLGFEVDELLDQRLRAHRDAGTSPTDALPDLYPLDEGLDLDLLKTALQLRPSVKKDDSPIGRRLPGPPPESVELMVDQLATALVPLSETYPLPHYLVGR